MYYRNFNTVAAITFFRSFLNFILIVLAANVAGYDNRKRKCCVKCQKMSKSIVKVKVKWTIRTQKILLYFSVNVLANFTKWNMIEMYCTTI